MSVESQPSQPTTNPQPVVDQFIQNLVADLRQLMEHCWQTDRFTELSAIIDQLAEVEPVSSEARSRYAEEVVLKWGFDDAAETAHTIAPDDERFIDGASKALAARILQPGVSEEELRAGAAKLQALQTKFPHEFYLPTRVIDVEIVLAHLTQKPDDFRTAAATLESLDWTRKGTTRYSRLGDIYLRLGILENDSAAIDKAEMAFGRHRLATRHLSVFVARAIVSGETEKFSGKESVLLANKPAPATHLAAAEFYLAWMIKDGDTLKGERAKTRLDLLERQMSWAVAEIGPDVAITVKAMRQRLAVGLAKIEAERAARYAAHYLTKGSKDDSNKRVAPPIPRGGYRLADNHARTVFERNKDKRLPVQPRVASPPPRRPSYEYQTPIPQPTRGWKR